MKILFVQNYNDKLCGISSLARVLGEKHQCSVVNTNVPGSLEEALHTFAPDVVGPFVLSKDHQWALHVARTAKAIDKNIFVILGGAHPTFFPEVAREPNIDAICIGEGEKVLPELLERLEANEDWEDVPSLGYVKNGELICNPLNPTLTADEIPSPDHSVYSDCGGLEDSGMLTVLASRGCPYDCFFCAQHELNKLYGRSYFRMRPVDDVIQELCQAVRETPTIELIKFQDDNFGASRKWLRAFLKEYREKVDLPFHCLMRCEYITEEMLDLLREAGCFRIGFGIESGDEAYCNQVLNKKLKDSSIEKAVTLLKKKRMSFHTFNMFGLPDQDFDSAMKTVDLNIRLNPNPGYAYIFQPYPGSKFFSDDVVDLILSPAFNRFKVNVPYNGDAIRLQRLQKLFMLTVKFPILRNTLPLLTRLPLDHLYDNLSKWCWSRFYDQAAKSKM